MVPNLWVLIQMGSEDVCDLFESYTFWETDIQKLCRYAAFFNHVTNVDCHTNCSHHEALALSYFDRVRAITKVVS